MFDTQASAYKTKRASFLDIQFITAGNYWRVTSPDGHRMYFGQSSASRIANPANGGLYEWLLSCEEDAIGTPCISGSAGNKIDYSYFVSNGVAYLEEVAYGQVPQRYVRFQLEATTRPDQPVSYLAGFPQQLTRRLDYIQVQAASGASPGTSNIIRRYDLVFSDASGSQSLDSSRSLLRAITLYGVGGGGAGLTTKFSYKQNTSGSTGWSSSLTSFPGASPLNNYVEINGDGLIDYYANHTVCLNNGASFNCTNNYPVPTWSTTPTAVDLTDASGATGAALVDLNRDGRADVVLRRLDLSAGTFTINERPAWIASGVSATTSPAQWTNTVPSIQGDPHLSFAQKAAGIVGATYPPGSAIFADLNGDGAPEIIVRGDTAKGSPASSCLERRRSQYVYANSGAMGFSLAGTVTSSTTPLSDCAGQGATWSGSDYAIPSGLNPSVSQVSVSATSPYYLATDSRSEVQYVDLNGDGLSDVVWTQYQAGSPATLTRHAYLNQGNKTLLESNDWHPPIDLVRDALGAPASNGVRFVDVNGDGLADVLRNLNNYGNQTWLGNGSSNGTTAYTPSTAWVLLAQGPLVDVNGDGLPDILTMSGVYLNVGSVPDLLASVETPYGGKTTIAYGVSTAAKDTATSPYPNANAFDVGFMPFAKPVVKAVEIDDANSHVGRTEYAYVRGVFDSTGREFLGFEKAIQIVGTSNGSGGMGSQERRVETTFKNTAAADAGLVTESVVYQASVSGSAYVYYPRVRTKTFYGTSTLARLPVRAVAIRSEEASAAPTLLQRSCTAVTYDAATGNATRIDALGLVTDDACTDDSTDSTPVRSTAISYATGGSIKSAPSRITLRSGVGGTIVRDTRLYYDGLANGLIASGLLTRSEGLNASGVVLTAATYAYDAGGKGLLIAATSPRENAGILTSGNGTSLLVYSPSIPDFVTQTQSRPIIGGQRLLTDISYSTNTSLCAASMPPLAGLPAVTTDPNGVQTVFCYDTFGRPVARVVLSGGSEVARTTYAYDDSKVTAATAPSITATTYLDTTNARSTTAKMDGFGRTVLESSTGPGSITSVAATLYDALGRVAGVTVPGDGTPGPATMFGYDGLDRVVSSTRPAAPGVPWTTSCTTYPFPVGTICTPLPPPPSYATTSYAIDIGRVRATLTNPVGAQSRQFANAFGDVVQVDEMTGTTPTSTTYAYEATGALAQIRDVNGSLWQYFYDGLGRRTVMIDPDTGTWAYTFDPSGNLTAQNGPRTATAPTPDPDTLTWVYDNLDRPVSMTRSATNTARTWQYDIAPVNGAGRFYQERDNNEGFGVLAYDALGRPTQERAVAAGKQFDFQTTYNRAGDVLTRIYPTGRVVTYARDARGYPTSVTSGADTYASSVNWNAGSQLTSWTAGNGIATTYGYSTFLVPTSFNAGGVENTTYTYTQNYQVAATSGTTASSFSYDARDRLLSATGPYNTGYAQTTLYYGYDSIGNLKCMDATAAPSGTTCTNGKYFTYPAANPTNPPARPHAPTAITGQTAPTFDAAGNMLSGNSRAYTYDAEGQVASIAYGGTTLTATYAGDGKAWKVTSGGVTRYRIFDDFEWNQTANLARTSVFLGGQLIAITEESFTPITYGGCGEVWPKTIPQPAGADIALTLLYALAGALAAPALRAIRRHRPRGARAWAAAGTGAAFLVFVSVPPQLVAEKAEAAAPANTTFFHPDRLGTSLVVSNNTGSASAKRVAYRPFGALVQNSGGTSTVPERGFTGQRFESGVGVYDYNARWYDPAIARFVQPDAIVRPYDPQSLNPFAYVHNDPLNRTDPTGNWDLSIGWGWGNLAEGWGFYAGPFGEGAISSYLANRDWTSCIFSPWSCIGNGLPGGFPGVPGSTPGAGSVFSHSSTSFVPIVVAGVVIIGEEAAAIGIGTLITGFLGSIIGKQLEDIWMSEGSGGTGGSRPKPEAPPVSTPASPIPPQFPQRPEEDPQKRGTPRTNQEQNKMVRDVAKKLRLDRPARAKLKKELELRVRKWGEQLDFHDIERIGREILDGSL